MMGEFFSGYIEGSEELNEQLNAHLRRLKEKVAFLQRNPASYPRITPGEFAKRVKEVPLPGGKSHYWEMDEELMQFLYPAGWLAKATICLRASLGEPQQIVVLGAQTARRDILSPAQWVFNQLPLDRQRVMKQCLSIHCVDALGPPADSSIWNVIPSQDEKKQANLTVQFATGRYETALIEDFLPRLDETDGFDNQAMHLIAEGCTDYLSTQTISNLFTLARDRASSFILRTIIPTAPDQFVSDEFRQSVITALEQDFSLPTSDETMTPSSQTVIPVATTIEQIGEYAWKQEFSLEQKQTKGLASDYPGNHIRPQDIVTVFGRLGRAVNYNLFSTTGSYPNGASIAIS